MTIDEMMMKAYNENVSVSEYAKDYVTKKSLMYAVNKIKDHFGIEMYFKTPIQIDAITKFIEELQPDKFKHRIENPYDRQFKTTLKGEFIMKLDKATYAFVSVSTKSKDIDYYIYMYLFGKKAYKWFKIISSKVTYSNNTNMMYSISAKGDSENNYWSCIGSYLKPRPMDTLFFDKGVKDKITKHLDDWLSNEDIYIDRGLIFKTGILLYGTAGTGKSSLASAIATYLNCGLITIETTNFDILNINEVVESINSDDKRYVILLDEIDSIFTSRDDPNITDSQKEKTAKLLAFLDSQLSPNNVVFVATTNYIDRLDNAVIRKGRFDMSIELTNFSKETALDMCKSFNLSDKDSEKVVSQFNTAKINPAELQSAILTQISGSKKVMI